MSNKDFWTEIHDNKVSNVRNRPKSAFKLCEECEAWQGHELTCSKVTVESIAKLLAHSRACEELSRQRASRWLESLQTLTGKLAILKQENNALRRNYEKLKKKHELLRKAIGQDKWSYLDEVFRLEELAKIEVNKFLNKKADPDTDNKERQQ